jgi:hypothetical protein
VLAGEGLAVAEIGCIVRRERNSQQVPFRNRLPI